MGLCIFDIDNLSFCLKFPVFQDERHVAVLGIVADVGDADTVAGSPGGSAGAGGGGDVGGKLGGTGSPFRFSLSLLQATSARASIASAKNLVFIISVILLVTNRHLHHHLSLLPSR